VVQEKERDIIFYLINKFIKRIIKIRIRIEVLKERGLLLKGANLGVL